LPISDPDSTVSADPKTVGRRVADCPLFSLEATWKYEFAFSVRNYTCIGTVTVQTTPTAGFGGELWFVTTPPVVKATLNADGPPQLIPIIVRLYAPAGRIDCGTTV
jgi:hypothetical protein